MVYSSLQGRLAQRESAAFTRQRSLVRTQHRPLPKYFVLQVKRGRQEQVSDTLPSHCAATVQQRGGEPVNVAVLGNVTITPSKKTPNYEWQSVMSARRLSTAPSGSAT